MSTATRPGEGARPPPAEGTRTAPTCPARGSSHLPRPGHQHRAEPSSRRALQGRTRAREGLSARHPQRGAAKRRGCFCGSKAVTCWKEPELTHCQEEHRPPLASPAPHPFEDLQRYPCMNTRGSPAPRPSLQPPGELQPWGGEHFRHPSHTSTHPSVIALRHCPGDGRYPWGAPSSQRCPRLRQRMSIIPPLAAEP